jgi:hypothetical protein
VPQKYQEQCSHLCSAKTQEQNQQFSHFVASLFGFHVEAAPHSHLSLESAYLDWRFLQFSSVLPEKFWDRS